MIDNVLLMKTINTFRKFSNEHIKVKNFKEKFLKVKFKPFFQIL